MSRGRLSPRTNAILAAVLFGAGTPLAKVLLGTVDPLVLAGMLYLGAGLGAALVLAVRRRASHGQRAPKLGARERLALGAAVVAGGLAAPILMMYGLRATPAGTASLLLNFEVVATTLIAAVAFHEAIGHRVWIAVTLITTAACLLAWRPGEPWGLSVGAVGILGACALWGLDNNLTRLVSTADPMTIVCVKGFGAGTIALALAAVVGAHVPTIRVSVMAIVLGSISFGLSIALFVRALQDLGAARTGALFGTAPFIGALISWAVLGETPGAMALVSLPLMAIGSFLLLTEVHHHRHHHAETLHEHSHTHDDGHHDHVHDPANATAGGRHSHLHRHPATTHDHPHAPDLHHRHDHSGR
jgi:drug/metabolite transporter (DMT)-like permease